MQSRICKQRTAKLQRLERKQHAQNAMRDVQVEDRRWLTMSFRFGPAIAERANEYLQAIHAKRLVRGHPGVASSVGPIPDPDAILVRTNATAVAFVRTRIASGSGIGPTLEATPGCPRTSRFAWIACRYSFARSAIAGPKRKLIVSQRRSSTCTSRIAFCACCFLSSLCSFAVLCLQIRDCIY